MKKISPVFKNDTDKLIALAMIIFSMFFIFIPALIVIFLPKNIISDTTYALAKAFFNFELLLFLISLTFIIPVIGWLLGVILGPILIIVNIIFIIINICAMAGNNEMKVPSFFEFI